jgi:hypothetical protein
MIFLPLSETTGVVLSPEGDSGTFVTRGPANERIPQRPATTEEIDTAKRRFWNDS